MNMKISIKKKYVGVFASALTILLGYMLVQKLLAFLDYQNLSVLILPIIFFVSLIYATSYWFSLRDNEKMADEASKEVSDGDPTKAIQVKEHLWQKIWEDAYTLNFHRGEIKFTSTWIEQKNFEKYRHIPKIIRQELNK